ncbi:Serine/threonine-protein kinase PknB [Bremerella volcania]|uniref:Serine/threonine-protein kinase PknB n=1 Tax=Bremerella volcania TaxID=2527984 RepID=A0A518C854_9BACT|nr:serine/threonine-protein kinase [Bremerella volcania]QDU75394.1 Serine/threonine-protein kinase PknB [Bremerella volcania]
MTSTAICQTCGTPLSTGAQFSFCPQCLAREAQAQPQVEFEKTTTESASSSHFTPPSAEELNQLLPGIEIIKLIGHGGMGAVYLGRQIVLDRKVAVKILPPVIQLASRLEERFQREAQTLAKLHHPNIVSVFDFGQVEKVCYLVMEYVDGVTLRDMIASRSISPDDALQMIPVICDALQFAHSRGVVHRDIKPENILVDRDGQVKIADFGLAKIMNHDASTASEIDFTKTQQVMGTFKYMAPEQMAKSKSVDHRADIYSLGVVFYELLTGEAPTGWFQPPSKKVAVDVRLDEVVLRTLESEPERRYQQASEIKTAIESLRDSPQAVPSEDNKDSTPMRLHKLLDVTESYYRRLHSVTTILGFSVLPLATFLLYWNVSLWAGHVGLVASIAMIGYSIRIKRHQVYEATYKGHTIRLDNSRMFAERLYLDDGLVRIGGFGSKMEFRFPIKAGEGLGDEVIVWLDAGFSSIRCRIEVESKSS